MATEVKKVKFVILIMCTQRPFHLISYKQNLFFDLCQLYWKLPEITLKNNDIVDREDDELNVLEICLAAENGAGEWTFKGGQRILKLWRIYLNEVPNSININIPITRVSISNVPLSYSNGNIKDKFTSMGYKLRSKIFDERCMGQREKAHPVFNR